MSKEVLVHVSGDNGCTGCIYMGLTKCPKNKYGKLSCIYGENWKHHGESFIWVKKEDDPEPVTCLLDRIEYDIKKGDIAADSDVMQLVNDHRRLMAENMDLKNTLVEINEKLDKIIKK